jgi:hypothetical protein
LEIKIKRILMNKILFNEKSRQSKIILILHNLIKILNKILRIRASKKFRILVMIKEILKKIYNKWSKNSLKVSLSNSKITYIII